MKLKGISILLITVTILCSCRTDNSDATPKPRGYFRLATPPAEYSVLEHDCPYAFDINKYARWERERQECWGDIYYPKMKARVQLTYRSVNDQNLESLITDSQGMAFEHVVRAEGMKDYIIRDDEKRVFGMIYQIAGDAASSAQFFLTDSTDNFLRGVLYFYASPNADSLSPVNDYMFDEITHLVETFQWQN